MEPLRNDRKPRKTLRRVKPHAKLIEAIGGPTQLAEDLQRDFKVTLRPLTVTMWSQRSVPHQYRPAVVAIARRKGVAHFIPTNFTIGG